MRSHSEANFVHMPCSLIPSQHFVFYTHSGDQGQGDTAGGTAGQRGPSQEGAYICVDCFFVLIYLLQQRASFVRRSIALRCYVQPSHCTYSHSTLCAGAGWREGGAGHPQSHCRGPDRARAGTLVCCEVCCVAYVVFVFCFICTHTKPMFKTMNNFGW